MISQPRETKQSYQQKVEANLETLQARIDELKAKAAQAKADARLRYHERIGVLDARQKEAQHKLRELKASSENAWQELKVGTEAALHELQNAFNSALAQFKS